MAKKKIRKVEEEDGDEFAPPPFDEREFYSTELELAKGTMVAALWGILVAVIATAVFALTGSFYFGFAVGVLAALVLKPILDRLRIITRQLGTMKWLGLFFSYFMCWVAFWILLVNPPILDLSPPQLKDRTPDLQELGGSLRLSIEVKENTGISSLTVEVVLPNGTVDRRDDFMETTPSLYQLDLNYTETGEYNYHFRVEDSTGKATAMDGLTKIVPSVPPVIKLIALIDNASITVDTPIYFWVQDNAQISGVYYTLDAASEKIYLKHVSGYDTYVSNGVRDNMYLIKPNSPSHRWATGPHNMTLVAADAAGNLVSQSYSFTIG